MVEITGARIRARRISAGMSLRTLARELQVSGVYMGEIERGRRAPALLMSRLNRLIDLFPGIDSTEDPIADRWIAEAPERAKRREQWLLPPGVTVRDATEEEQRAALEAGATFLPGKVPAVLEYHPECDYGSLGYPETGLGYSDLDEVAWVVGFSTRGIHDYARRMAR